MSRYLNSVLAIRRSGETNAPLATTEAPLLEPGRLAQVALDLPPGTQPEGNAVYTLFADELLMTGDADLSHNTADFAVNLWVDSDGDGMPDGWERANGCDPANTTDAEADFDLDGVTNLAEYRAGTSPTDAESYLRIESISVGGEAAGVRFTWGSIAGRLYTIERSAALPGGFEPIAQHLLPTPPENSFTDLTMTNAAVCFYRIKVE
jgi:hypothetical protein